MEFSPVHGDHGAMENGEREANVYQQIMLDVHRQWLQEFDRDAALKRMVIGQPRRRRRLRLAAILHLVRVRREARQPALAGRLPEAPQCC